VVGINKPELRIRRDLAEVMDLAGRANDAALQTIRAQRMPSEIADPELAPRVVVAALACRRSVAIAIPGLGFALSRGPGATCMGGRLGIQHAPGDSKPASASIARWPASSSLPASTSTHRHSETVEHTSTRYFIADLPMASPGGVVIGDHGQSSPFWCRNSLLDWGESAVHSCGGP
jgi:hypothetical protein